MKSPSRTFLWLSLLTLSGLFPARASASADNLFLIVPPQDPTYAELGQLEKAGLLAPKQDSGPLTRYEVVQLILKAEKKRDEIVVADAIAIPPPPDEGSAVSPAPASAPDLGASVSQIAAQEAQARAQAVGSLNSLEEAYQFELKEVKDKLQSLSDEVDDLDAQQYDFRKKLKGMTRNPTIAVHGLGRVFGLAQQYEGNYSGVAFVNPGVRALSGFLDLEPEGTVSKEVRWSSILRTSSTFQSDPTDFQLNLRKITLEFNPTWLSATLGDFEESYTPLTLWNRDSLDLRYTPEMWARQDDEAKYESFLNQEPDWPLRGLKVGTTLMWPDSTFADQLKLSAFAHMIRNGFDTGGTGGGWFFGPNIYTDWLLGGTSSFKTKKMWTGGISWQGDLDSYGLILDEPLDTASPLSSYNSLNPATWAHQYLIGSVKPEVKAGLGGDFYMGAGMECAFASYQDDKRDPQRVVSDFALLGGPSLQIGNSKISLNYLNVGPYYYNPMAQTRQDAVTQLPGYKSVTSPELLGPALRSQYFLTDIPRPGEIYSFYDRTLDNTFPYGLATPNREGFGGEVDVRAFDKEALRIRGAAYFVREITGNLIFNSAQTGYTPVDSNNPAVVPVRDFIYVNLGPSFNLGPSLGFERDIEIGTNFRFEQTNSDLGTLTSVWAIGGLRVGITSFWEASAAYSYRSAQGQEAGYGGTLMARYPYLYDLTDAGQYTLFNVNGTVQSLRFSSSIKVNPQSSLYLDYDWSTGDMLSAYPLAGNLNNEFAEVTYEIQF